MIMKDEVNKQLYLGLAPVPLLEGIPEEFKDPKKYKEIEKKLAKLMISDHEHKTMKAFNKCKRCQAKFHKKRQAILDLGFKSIQQYQQYKKIMLIIINKKPLFLHERNSNSKTEG